MKLVLIILLVWLLLIATTGCRKEPVVVQTISRVNTAPIAYAGADTLVLLPQNTCLLSGNATDLENNIQSTVWKKVSGPESHLIENPNLLVSKVSQLVEGVYQFELSVVDSGGLMSKDTVKVEIVQNISASHHSKNTINLMLPQDWVILNSFYDNPVTVVKEVKCAKISGPAQYKIGYQNTEYTTIFGMAKGSYEFELTINFTNGSISKDTVDVNIFDVSNMPQNAKEIILTDQKWIYPWYSEVEIKKFYSLIPPESLFRIFIRRDGSAGWIDVPAGIYSDNSDIKYDYFIERRLPDGAGMYTNGSLFIGGYGEYPQDTPDVKIVYW